MIPVLVEQGAKVNRENTKGMTPIMFAILNAEIRSIAALIECGANLGYARKPFFMWPRWVERRLLGHSLAVQPRHG